MKKKKGRRIEDGELLNSFFMLVRGFYCHFVYPSFLFLFLFNLGAREWGGWKGSKVTCRHTWGDDNKHVKLRVFEIRG